MKRMWKKNLLGYIAVAVVCVMIGSAATLAANPTAQAENTQTVVLTSPFTQAISQVQDSVVGISNYQMVRYGGSGYTWGDYFGFGFGNGGGRDNVEPQYQEVEAATGSGVVVGDGYVLTNYHVIEDANSLKVTVSKNGSDEPDRYDAAVVTYDENLDVAILYAPDLKLPAVKLGDSDTLMVGDWAICIGNPLGQQFAGTVTTGIVSALNRAVSSSSYDKYGRKETITNTMVQVDAAINSGNSGGGMFNVSGELMGIPTLKYSGSAFSGSTVEGIGMCIPINAAKPLIEDALAAKPPVVAKSGSDANATVASDLTGKPRLGVTVANMNTNNSAVRTGVLPTGAFVKEVEAGSPAEQAGIQPGDIIVDADGTVISDVSQLTGILQQHQAGDTLAIKVYRVPGLADLEATAEIPDGEYIDLQVTLAVVDDVKQ